MQTTTTSTLFTAFAIVASFLTASAIFAGLWTGSALSLLPAAATFFAAVYCQARRMDVETVTSESPTPRVDRRPQVRHSIPAFG